MAFRRRERPNAGRDAVGVRPRRIQFRRGENRLGTIRRRLRSRHPTVHLQGGRRNDTESADARVEIILGVSLCAIGVRAVHVALPHVKVRPLAAIVGKRSPVAATLSQNAAICIDNRRFVENRTTTSTTTTRNNGNKTEKRKKKRDFNPRGWDYCHSYFAFLLNFFFLGWLGRHFSFSFCFVFFYEKTIRSCVTFFLNLCVVVSVNCR